MDEFEKEYRLGWIPDLSDFRDYNMEHDIISPKLKKLNVESSVLTMVKKLNVSETEKVNLPTSADLRAWCSKIEHQLNLGSCTAQAAVGIVEYFENRAFGKYVNASRLFLYKVTRKLMGLKGDTGAELRSTMGALALFGLPPEKYYPYVTVNFDDEPDAFCYSLANNYKSIQYFRLDDSNTNGALLLNKVKSFIAAGIPSMFGFTVYESIQRSENPGEIPFPSDRENILGGHAIVAVGYDDSKVIENVYSKEKTNGALLIRNSWGPYWGDGGYGWLPYEYILKGIASDFWVILKNSWVDTGSFGL